MQIYTQDKNGNFVSYHMYVTKDIENKDGSVTKVTYKLQDDYTYKEISRQTEDATIDDSEFW